MTRPTILLNLAIGAATVLGACSSGAVPSPTGPAPSPSAPGSSAGPATVDGRTFLSTDVQGMVLVPGTRIRLTFKDGNLSAQGGCNSMGGAYTIAGDRLTATQMFMTEMGCDEPRMRQDEWLSRLLGGATIALEGDTLTLDDGTVRLTMVDREVASPDKPIEGTRWLLDGIVTGDAISSVPAGVTASLRIVGGRAEVEAGCNTGGGTVAVGPDTLTFGPLALTKKACERAAMAVEQAVTTVLAGAVPYTIEEGVLNLDAGSAGLMFRAAP